MSKKNGGPAFPVPSSSFGMSLRDWFAGQAIIGVMRAKAVDCIWNDDHIAKYAYAVANALLKQREMEEEK